MIALKSDTVEDFILAPYSIALVGRGCYDSHFRDQETESGAGETA